ncbi:MAG TPA: type II secretion system protein G, partial [Candidatus Methylomirabilis sp.]|nr:type II secretion system protein G [Candidatus Methylomirabilis sp.]
MIVLVIIGILVTLAQPSFTTSVQRAREAALKENLFVMRDVIDQHYADHGEYPPSLEVLIEK